MFTLPHRAPLAALVVFAAGTASADTLELVASGVGYPGTWIREDQVTTNASDDILFVGGLGNGSALRGVISFDLSSIPAGSTIDSIQLLLQVEQNDANTTNNITTDVTLQRLTQTPTDAATWSTRDGTDPWLTPGGSFLPTVLSSVSGNPDTAVEGDDYLFASSLEFVAAAQAAVDGGSPLDLIIRAAGLEDSTTNRGLFRFDGVEDSNTNPNPGDPVLTIQYTPVPEPATLALVAAGLACVGRRRR